MPLRTTQRFFALLISICMHSGETQISSIVLFPSNHICIHFCQYEWYIVRESDKPQQKKSILCSEPLRRKYNKFITFLMNSQIQPLFTASTDAGPHWNDPVCIKNTKLFYQFCQEHNYLFTVTLGNSLSTQTPCTHSIKINFSFVSLT